MENVTRKSSHVPLFGKCLMLILHVRFTPPNEVNFGWKLIVIFDSWLSYRKSDSFNDVESFKLKLISCFGQNLYIRINFCLVKAKRKLKQQLWPFWCSIFSTPLVKNKCLFKCRYDNEIAMNSIAIESKWKSKRFVSAIETAHIMQASIHFIFMVGEHIKKNWYDHGRGHRDFMSNGMVRIRAWDCMQRMCTMWTRSHCESLHDCIV